MQEIIEWLKNCWWAALIGCGCLIEFTPIKINPLSAIFKWIGRAVNGEVLHKIEAIESRADRQQRTIDENEIDRIRWEVLDFANACRNHRKHTKDEFHHIIALNEKYHNLLKKYNDTNGIFDEEYKYICELYHECQKNNSFL